MNKNHRPAEDCGGYYCKICGMSLMRDELPECPGPQPTLSRYDLSVAYMALQFVQQKGGVPGAGFAAENFKKYLEWPGDSSRLV